MLDFAGRWYTTFGPLDLVLAGDHVQGQYLSPGGVGTVVGKLTDSRLDFRYEEPRETGEGFYELNRYGQFSGRYRPDGQDCWFDWQGSRGWDGVWDSSFGRLRLFQEPKAVHGFYEGAGPSTLRGTIKKDRLIFKYKEPTLGGEGWFELAEDAQSFLGQWRPTGATGWAVWKGERVRQTPRLTWLIVLEAHWQRSFGDREYAFGTMIKEFFARLGHVEVRHRYFNDAESLERWCRELMYFPEPAVVLIASHGTPEGINVHGRSINTHLVLDYLRYASNIRLLHFSSCLIMKEEQTGEFAKKIEGKTSFPISGYTTSVDWGGSAIMEFNYLDMILTKGLSPADAAAQLPKMIQYAGDDVAPDSPYPAAGFRFFQNK